MKIGVLGAGSWGTTLAVHLAKKGCEVKLWDGDSALLETLSEKRDNLRYMPGLHLPEMVHIIRESTQAVEGVELVVVAVPSHAVREVVAKVRGSAGGAIIVSVAKGLETGTFLRMSQVIEEVLGRDSRLVVLSGPSHAEEVSRSIPTTIVACSRDDELARKVQVVFMTETLRVYTNPDVTGVELGGTLKNPIAIAAGISDGLGFGDNTKAALMTRGLAEITRLGVKLGAEPRTFAGLTGIGDLITTCISRHSRNRNLGELIARGRSLEQALADIGQVAEGVRTSRAASELAHRLGVEAPITEQVCAVLFEGKPPLKAVADLMRRTARPEMESEFLET